MEEYIIVNGVKMTLKDFKAMVKEKRGETKTKKRKKTTTELGIVSQEIEKMITPMVTLKSIKAFNRNAYRQWGTIADEILAHKRLSKAFSKYSVAYGELNELLEEVKKLAKNNEKAAIQYVEKMAWKLDDLRTEITELSKATEESGVLKRFGQHEAIVGSKKRLGLLPIIEKCKQALKEVDKVIDNLNKIVDDGLDPLNYGNYMSPKQRARCWA